MSALIQDSLYLPPSALGSILEPKARCSVTYRIHEASCGNLWFNPVVTGISSLELASKERARLQSLNPGARYVLVAETVIMTVEPIAPVSS